jgi:hypothetical protein
MKKNLYITNIASLFALTLIVVISCKKEEANEFKLSRTFAPATVTTTLTETTAKISWPQALFTNAGEATYLVEVSKDPNFGTIAYTKTTNDLSTTVTEADIAVRTNYYARVKALGADGTADSNYSMSSVFRMTGEQYLYPIPATDATDVEVLVKWKANPVLNRLVVTPTAGGTPVEVALTPTDHAALQKVVSGLTQLTDYSVEIYQDTKSKGIQSFKTKATITGNIVDLSGTTGDPNLLKANITSAPSGSVIVLRRGERYNLDVATTFTNKSLTIVSKLGFGTNYATIRSSSNFTISAGSAIDSIVFRDLIIKGASAASFDANYVFNIANAGTISKLRFDNCIIKWLRGMVRATATTTVISNYFVNNCQVDSIKDFSVVQVTAPSNFQNVKITNSTFYKCRKFINHPVAATSVLVENCTFNEVVSNSTTTNFLIDYGSANVANGITLKNCIFGKTWTEPGGATIINGYRAGSGTALSVITCFATSDFTFGANPLLGTTPYSGTSAALFKDPQNDIATPVYQNADFTIKDANFAGKSTTGDPRWRIF